MCGWYRRPESRRDCVATYTLRVVKKLVVGDVARILLWEGGWRREQICAGGGEGCDGVGYGCVLLVNGRAEELNAGVICLVGGYYMLEVLDCTET